VLLRTYARTALDVRRRFERLVAPVGTAAPFVEMARDEEVR
jgi:hypothetical protein